LKRSRRWFGIVRPDPHAGQNSQLWLINSCERAPREAAPSNRHPSLSIEFPESEEDPCETRRTRAVSLGEGRRGNPMVEKRRGKSRREVMRAVATGVPAGFLLRISHGSIGKNDAAAG
jgi:hypothetical protein